MHLYHRIARLRQAWAVLGFVLAGALALPWPAAAVPSYTRQTGQPCTACHMNFPELTPFGRTFKLGGYTLSAGDISFPPFSFVATTGFTHTQAPQPGGAAPHFGPNNNFSLEFASLYYAGKVFDNVGAFWQVTYDGLGRVFRPGYRHPVGLFAVAGRPDHRVALGHLAAGGRSCLTGTAHPAVKDGVRGVCGGHRLALHRSAAHRPARAPP